MMPRQVKQMLRLNVVLLALCLGVSSTSAQEKRSWESFVDASFVREVVASNNQLYLASTGGLLIFDPATSEFEQFGVADGLPSNQLNCLVFMGDVLFVGTDDAGIVKVSFGNGVISTRTIGEFNGLPSNRVASLAVQGSRLLYGTDKGAGVVVDDIPLRTFTTADGLPSDVVNDVYVDGAAVWVATDGGMIYLDSFDIINVVSAGPPDGNAVVRGANGIWVGSDSGVWQMALSDSSWTNTGPSEPIFSLDFDGATLRAGARARFHERVGSSWTPQSLSAFSVLYSLNGTITEVQSLTTMNGVVYSCIGQVNAARGTNLLATIGGSTTNHVPDNPGGNRIFRLDFDADGSLWANVNNYGVAKRSATANRWLGYNSSVPEGDSLSSDFANLGFLADSQGSKWFTAPNGGVLDELRDQMDDNYANDIWVRHSVGAGIGDGLGTTAFQQAAEDPMGNRWFLSNDGGINILRADRSLGDEWLQVSTLSSPGMPADNVIDVTFGNGVAYVAFFDYGVKSWECGGFSWGELSDFTGDTWGFNVDAASGVELTADPAPQMTSIELRDDRVLWIGTTGGVYKHDLDAFPSTFFLIGQNTGFTAGLLGSNARDIALDASGDLWVATDLGLNKISRDDDNDIDAFSTAAAFSTTLSQFQYPFDVVTPLVDADCRALLVDDDAGLVYIGTSGGISITTILPPEAPPSPLQEAYLYPNPVYGRKGHDVVRIENIASPVFVEIYNLEGELVIENNVQAAGDIAWNLLTSSGFLASSGKYLLRVSDGTSAIVLPLAVIR